MRDVAVDVPYGWLYKLEHLSRNSNIRFSTVNVGGVNLDAPNELALP